MFAENQDQRVAKFELLGDREVGKVELSSKGVSEAFGRHTRNSGFLLSRSVAALRPAKWVRYRPINVETVAKVEKMTHREFQDSLHRIDTRGLANVEVSRSRSILSDADSSGRRQLRRGKSPKDFRINVPHQPIQLNFSKARPKKAAIRPLSGAIKKERNKSNDPWVPTTDEAVLLREIEYKEDLIASRIKVIQGVVGALETARSQLTDEHIDRLKKNTTQEYFNSCAYVNLKNAQREHFIKAKVGNHVRKMLTRNNAQSQSVQQLKARKESGPPRHDKNFNYHGKLKDDLSYQCHLKFRCSIDNKLQAAQINPPAARVHISLNEAFRKTKVIK